MEQTSAKANIVLPAVESPVLPSEGQLRHLRLARAELQMLTELEQSAAKVAEILCQHDHADEASLFREGFLLRYNLDSAAIALIGLGDPETCARLKEISENLRNYLNVSPSVPRHEMGEYFSGLRQNLKDIKDRYSERFDLASGGG